MTEGPDDFSERLPWRREFDPDSLIGWVVEGKYKLLNYLGGGGFSEVFVACNIDLVDQRVVVKFLKHPSTHDRFAQEARILCRLDHPNICRVIDFAPQGMALIMQYISGRDCQQLIDETDGPLDEELIIRIAKGVTSALACAHSAGVAHRDIKPGNIMVDNQGRVFVIDFGIAKEMTATTLTRTGQNVLTPQYAAPERRIPGRAYDPLLSDIYEIGATLCMLATRLSPNDQSVGESPLDDGRQFLQHKLSKSFRVLIERATQSHPNDRYLTIQEFRNDLGKVNHVYAARYPRFLNVGVVLSILAAIAIAWTGIPFLNSLVEPQDHVESSINSGKDFNDHSLHIDLATNPALSDSSVFHDSSVSHAESDSGLSPSLHNEIIGVSNFSSQSPLKADQNTLDVKRQSAQSLIDLPDSNPELREEQVEFDTGETVDQPSTGTALFHVQVLPVDNSNPIVHVDDVDSNTGLTLNLVRGPHEFRIIDPRYPIATDVVTILSDTTLYYDLAARFARHRKLSLNVFLDPALLGGTMLLTLNGQDITDEKENLPFVIDGALTTGIWLVAADLQDSTGLSRDIDSIVVFPYGSGPKAIIEGTSGIMDLTLLGWPGTWLVDLKICWSRTE